MVIVGAVVGALLVGPQLHQEGVLGGIGLDGKVVAGDPQARFVRLLVGAPEPNPNLPAVRPIVSVDDHVSGEGIVGPELRFGLLVHEQRIVGTPVRPADPRRKVVAERPRAIRATIGHVVPLLRIQTPVVQERFPVGTRVGKVLEQQVGLQDIDRNRDRLSHGQPLAHRGNDAVGIDARDLTGFYLVDERQRALARHVEGAGPYDLAGCTAGRNVYVAFGQHLLEGKPGRQRVADVGQHTGIGALVGKLDRIGHQPLGIVAEQAGGIDADGRLKAGRRPAVVDHRQKVLAAADIDQNPGRTQLGVIGQPAPGLILELERVLGDRHRGPVLDEQFALGGDLVGTAPDDGAAGTAGRVRDVAAGRHSGHCHAGGQHVGDGGQRRGRIAIVGKGDGVGHRLPRSSPQRGGRLADRDRRIGLVDQQPGLGLVVAAHIGGGDGVGVGHRVGLNRSGDVHQVADAQSTRHGDGDRSRPLDLWCSVVPRLDGPLAVYCQTDKLKAGRQHVDQRRDLEGGGGGVAQRDRILGKLTWDNDRWIDGLGHFQVGARCLG